MENVSEYQSGEDYDAQYEKNYEPDIAWLTRLVGERGGPVLDICCGTGIVTVPIAQLGVPTVGIDIVPAMLDVAKRKAKGLANLALHLDNALTFKLTQRFNFAIMTGNAFQAFHTQAEIRQLLANIAAHLQSGATFIFDTRLPAGFDLSDKPEFQLLHCFINAKGEQVSLFYKTQYKPDKQLLTYDKCYRWEDGREQVTDITLKFTALTELEAYLDEAGFDIQARYQNWQPTPFEPGGANIIFELSKR